MFKVPDWDDTPNNNLSFTNVSQKVKNKSKKSNTSAKQKQNVEAKPKFKAKITPNTKIKAENIKKAVKKQKLKEKYNTQRHQEFSLKKDVKYHNEKLDIKNGSDDHINIKNYNSNKLDELILDVKQQRLDTYKTDDNEEILFHETQGKIIAHNKNNIITSSAKKSSKNSKKKHDSHNQQTLLNQKHNTIVKNNTDNVNDCKLVKNIVTVKEKRKKEALKSILQKESHRSPINISSGSKLRDRMLDRLKAAKFRYLNEKLYTSTGSDAQKLFQTDPHAFQTYHDGYQQQVKKWPVKPLDVIVKRIQKMPKSHKIADMGCGEAELSRRVSQSVRSFDLVASGPGVEACDMAHTPLLAASVDAAVYCLALMGTDLTQYLLEASRVLRIGGHLLIAEVESRFDDVETFTRDVQKLGFSLKKLDKTHKVFFFLEFTKVREPPVKRGKLPTLTLKPCIYKKR